MIRFRVRGLQFCLPLPVRLMPLLAARLGMRADLPALAIALSALNIAAIPLRAGCTRRSWTI